jgi:hypothetical protein
MVAVVRVWGDSVIALLLPIALVVALVAVGFGAAAVGENVTWKPFARQAVYELSDGTSRTSAEALLQRVRGEFAADPARYHFELEQRDGSLRLVAVCEDRADVRTVTAVVRASSLWTGSVSSGAVWGFIVERAVSDPGDALSAATGLLPLFLALGGVSYIVAGAAFRRWRPVEGYEATPPPWCTSLALGITLGSGGLALAYTVTFIVRWLGLEVREQNAILELAQGTPLGMAALAFGAVALAPLGEELFFRGHVFRYLAANADSTVAYVVSALIFALMHLNPSGIPAYLVAGFVLAWAYQRWRSLRVPMIAHATWNTIGVAVLLLP